MRLATLEDVRGENRRPARILLAEDDADIRAELTRLLELDGHVVYPLKDGLELLDSMSDWILARDPDPPIDLIITDVRMPGFNGLNIVEGLRANGWTKPIIVISAFGDREMRDRIQAMTDVVFFDKPFDAARFEDAVAALSPREETEARRPIV